MTDLADKLFNLLTETGSGCWEFVGAVTGSGYGSLSVSKHVQYSTHRLAYELWCGSIPKGMRVCHTCDNKLCCRPEHLFLGTAQDNKDDEIAKNRHAKGSRQGSSKLNEIMVLEIKELIVQGNYSLNQIGRMFGVTGEAIGLIKHGVNWGWLQ